MLGIEPVWLLSSVTLLSAIELAIAQTWSTTPFNPPAIPIAVKTPYFNSWLSQGPNHALNEAWPQFWDGAGSDPGNSSDTQWYAAVKVDGTAYRILGNATIPNVNVANQIAMEFTATRSSFLLEAGPVEINATFLSPINPFNLTIMSMPISFFYLTARSTDNDEHDVHVYSDVSSQWATRATLNGTEVGYVNMASGLHLFAQPNNAQDFTQVGERSLDLTVYYSMKNASGMSWEIGLDDEVRTTFAADSTLISVQDPDLSLEGNIGGTPGVSNSIQDASNDLRLPVLGFAMDLGSIKDETDPVVWQLTVAQGATIQYASSSGLQKRASYFWSQFGIDDTAAILSTPFTDGGAANFIQGTLLDFDDILAQSIELDNQIRFDGLIFSSEYADLLDLSVRQAMASMEITVAAGSDGKWNNSDIKSFMKNMGNLGSSEGDSVSAVDILYTTFPVILYLNANLGGYLLDPLLSFMDTATYTLPYAVQDLGHDYPNATGNGNTPHSYGIEEAANMLIMTAAYSTKAFDYNLIESHYPLLSVWADYLSENSLIPGDQLAPEFSESNYVNMTNLALKGILGIGAMSQISNATGILTDGGRFMNIAETLMHEWSQLALSSDGTHLKLSYNVDGSSGLMYNMYADSLLKLGLIPQTLTALQTAFYFQQIPSSAFGIATTTGHLTSRADWMMFSAASLSDDTVRNDMISQLHHYVSSNTSSVPFSIQFVTGLDTSMAFSPNSPAAGSMFVLLAINHTASSTTTSQSGTIVSKHSRTLVIVVASVLSSVGGLALFGLGGFLLRRRNIRKRRETIGVRLRDFRFNSGRPAPENHELSRIQSSVGGEPPQDDLSDAYIRKGMMEEQSAIGHDIDLPAYDGPKLEYNYVKTGL